jgi:hypothetical protein
LQKEQEHPTNLAKGLHPQVVLKTKERQKKQGSNQQRLGIFDDLQITRELSCPSPVVRRLMLSCNTSSIKHATTVPVPACREGKDGGKKNLTDCSLLSRENLCNGICGLPDLQDGKR